MDARRLVLLASLLPLAPAVHAQGLAIDHQPVGCIVAGRYPRLSACFSPTSQLARARVYFRAGSRGTDWYYVEMKSDAPCWQGVLPRPKKELVGQTVEYYVDAADRGFGESRTEEIRALVVESASECNAKLPVAPLLNAAAVTVFPAVPAGFAGAGLGLGTAAAIVGGGAALAGGGVAIAAAGGNSGAGGGPAATLPPDSFPVATNPTTTTTTTMLSGFSPVFDVLKGGVPVTATTVDGADPLVLTFDMCRSSGPHKLAFDVDVDGAKVAAGCRSTVTFTASGARASRRGTLRRSVAGRVYEVWMHVRSLAPSNEPQASKKVTVEVAGATSAGCSTDTQGPSATLTLPAPGSIYSTAAQYPVHFEAAADDSASGNNGVASVEYKVNYPGPTQAVLGPAAGGRFAFDWPQGEVEKWLGSDCRRLATLQAFAVDGCGNATYSAGVQVTLASTATSCSTPAFAAQRSGGLLSELSVPNGAGQLVVNGTAVFPRAGRSEVAVPLAPGQNRVEATLVEGTSSGTWRFDLGALPGVQPGSVRVIAGDVIQSGGDAIAFRVHGRAGERIVFSFETQPQEN